MRFRQSLFWDVDPKKINSKKHGWYILERILDLGNDEEIRWAFRTYPQNLIKQVVTQSRVLHNKSRGLWKLLYR